jgi:VIT1/CCC1 family predicted Fe2+/Mn2+ transporter
MGSLAEKWRNLTLFRAMREADDPARARQLMSDGLPSAIVGVFSDAELDSFHQRLRALPEPPARAHLSAEEWRGALGVMLLVFLSTFPVSLPFVFMHQLELAMRVSNLIAIVLLFICGAIYGRCVGRSPWLVGVSMVVLGGFLVGMTIALGG